MIFSKTDPSLHKLSAVDGITLQSIENKHMQLLEFNHAMHLRLAYCYLVKFGPQNAAKHMKKTLISFLSFHGVDPAKYHETITQGWLKAVWHFMQQSHPTPSSEAFLKTNPVLLNKEILLSHYSEDLLFSAQARCQYLAPDLNPFPDSE